MIEVMQRKPKWLTSLITLKFCMPSEIILNASRMLELGSLAAAGVGLRRSAPEIVPAIHRRHEPGRAREWRDRPCPAGALDAR